MELAPELVLLLVLPPIIYASAVAMSWREFRFNLRPIGLLAIGCVVFTTVATAAAAHWLLGLAWPVGFVLGAIVSPPDAVAPLSIARRLQIPRRILVILEGEGLANDATALVLYRFAVIAVSAGTFSLGEAAATFVTILVGEILRLISAATRLQGIFFWDFLIYSIEGMVFLITGLQARTLIERIAGYSMWDLAVSAAVISAVVIVTRFIWIYPATYLPRLLIPSIERADPSPPWEWPFVLGFTGVRGIVSLAAALGIPFATAGGQAFPGRDLILFLTFSVILVTLVGQGLTLPGVIRMLGLAHAGRHERHAERVEEHEARRQAIEAVIRRLDELKAERDWSEDVVRPLRVHHHDRLKHVDHRRAGGERDGKFIDIHDEIELELIAAERDHINDMYRDGKLKDETRRRIERELDLR